MVPPGRRPPGWDVGISFVVIVVFEVVAGGAAGVQNSPEAH